MDVLIVGAGAIGQVLGLHLVRAGAKVSVLVQPDQVDVARRGFPLYRLNARHPFQTPERLRPTTIYGSPAKVGQDRFDIVFLSLPSPVLRSGLVEELAPYLGDATVVLLSAGIDDREILLDHVRETHLVQGMLSLVSYATPLAEERPPVPGTAFWFPPGAKTRFAGPPERARGVAELLFAGGMPAAWLPDQRSVSPATGAVVMPYLLALEGAGWSLEALRRSPLLVEAGLATVEARAVVAALEGGTPRGHAPPPMLVRGLLRLAPHLLPFPLEAYLARHFAKVSAQTHLMSEALRDRGISLGLSVPHLTGLLARLDVCSPDAARAPSGGRPDPAHDAPQRPPDVHAA